MSATNITHLQLTPGKEMHELWALANNMAAEAPNKTSVELSTAIYVALVDTYTAGHERGGIHAVKVVNDTLARVGRR